MFAKNGFQDVAQKIKLNSFINSWSSSTETKHLSSAQRLRLSLEELGPTFIKLGQLLATRPDIIPQDFVNEFRKLQDQIPPVDWFEIEKILNAQYPQGYQKVFAFIDPSAIGSASIAQVHRAQLVNGEHVVVKIQKPNVAELIEDDVRIMHILADLCEDYLPESRVFNPRGMVSELARSMSLETNFVVEANNIKRFQENFLDLPEIKIPHIYLDYSGPKVLVMEELSGVPLSHPRALPTSLSERQQLMKVGMKAYFNMVFKDGLFHGDLHAGNIFVLPDQRLGFVDFGMVGRLSRKNQNAIANMLLALLTEDYERMAYEYIELAPFHPSTNRLMFAQDLRSILSPFFGLNLKEVNMGKLLLESSRVAARHHVVVPSDLMMFFKSLVTIEGLARTIQDDFDLLPFINEHASEFVKTRISTKDLFSEATFQFKEWSSLLETLPKEIKSQLRKINQPDYAYQVDLKSMESLQRTLFVGSRQIYSAMIIAALIIAGAMTVDLPQTQHFYGLPTLSLVFFVLAGLLFIRSFFKSR